MASATETAVLYGALEGSIARSAWNTKIELGQSVDLSGIDLSNYDLRGLTFKACILREAKFDGSRADGVCFDGAILDNASFQRASLRAATFNRAKGPGANFSNANLAETDLTWCNLRGALMAGVDLSTTILWKTDLRDAIFPDGSFTPEQDVRKSARPIRDTRVSLREFLSIVSGIVGTPYRLPGSAPGPKVELPEDLRENPTIYLARTVRELGLRIEPRQGPTGDVSHYEIVQ